MEFCGFSGASAESGNPIWPETMSKIFPEINAAEEGLLLEAPNPPEEVLVVEIPTFHNLLTSAQTVMENPLTKRIAMGVATGALLCTIWKLQRYLDWGSKPKKISKKKYPGEKFTSELGQISISEDGAPVNSTGTGCFDINQWTNGDGVPGFSQGGDGIEKTIARSSLQSFQRQLADVLTKLDRARLQLNELEADKNLLAAELEVRQKALVNLQTENKEERELRQRAEMKMELMEYENSQLKKMRRELTNKASQLERLAKCVKDKEEYQEKLFEENVVLPRSVAQARAKEFKDMQARLQILEARLVGIRGHEMDSPPSSSDSSTGEKADLSSSDISLTKVRRLIKAPEWVVKSASSPTITVSEIKICSPAPSPPSVSVNEGDSNSSEEPTLEYQPARAETPVEEEQCHNDLLSKDSGLPKETSPSRPTDPDNCTSSTVSPQKGIISKIKAFVKGYSDTSSESGLSLSTTSMKDVHKSSAERKREEEKKSSPPHVDSNSTGRLMTSCRSSSGDPSPDVFESFCNNANSANNTNTASKTASTSPAKRPVKFESSSSTMPSPTPLGLQRKKEETHNIAAKANEHVSRKSSAQLRQKEKHKQYHFSTKQFQVRYRPRPRGAGDDHTVHYRKEENGSESDDSWCVIVPK